MGEANDDTTDAEMAEESLTPDELHACPAHPQTRALGACSRCGTFFCVRCFVDSDRAPEGTRCPACPVEAVEPRALGGWLWLPGLGLLVNTVQTCRLIAQELNAIDGAESPELLVVLVAELATLVGFLVLTLFAALYFVQRKKRAVPLMLGYYGAQVGLLVMDIVVALYLEDQMGIPAELDGAMIARGLVGPAIWIAYFTNSKRVRETFLVDP